MMKGRDHVGNCRSYSVEFSEVIDLSWELTRHDLSRSVVIHSSSHCFTLSSDFQSGFRCKPSAIDVLRSLHISGAKVITFLTTSM